MTERRRPMATPEQLAEYVGVPIKTVYDWRRNRIGPRASRIGKHLRYAWSDIDAWVERQGKAGAA